MSCDNIYFVGEPSFRNPGGGGEANTASNIGGGVELFKTKDLLDLQFRTFVAGDGMSISLSGDTVVFESTGGISNGTSTNNTLRWNGTNWVESNFLLNDGTKVGVGALNAGSIFNVESNTSNTVARFQNSGTGITLIAYGASDTNEAVFISQQGNAEGLYISMGTAVTGKSISIFSNKSAGDHFVINQNVGGYKDIFRIDFLGNIVSNPLKTTTAHPAGYHSLYVDSATGLVYSQAVAGGGGLDYWTESEYTYSGSTGTKFTPSSGNTNQDIVISPKGTGFFALREPDGTTTGGSDRGAYAVDLQMNINNVSQVASGSNSFTAGTRNRADSIATVAIGSTNEATSNYAVAIGYTNVASGYASLSMGYFNTSSDNYATSFGSNNVASGRYATAYGLGNTAYSYGETATGLYATSYTPASTTAFDSTDRLFVIGNGTGTGARSNALVVYKSGAVEFNEAFTFPTADGTAGQVLQTDGSGVVTWETAGGGLDYWTESEFTYSGATGTKFVPNSVNTNQSIVLQPKGTGAILAQQPDGTTAGGNNRGDNAVDLQTSRTSSADVASGDYSVVLGGADNHATADYTVVGGGYRNEVKGFGSTIAGGYDNIVQGAYATIAGGNGNDTDASYSFIGGGQQNTMHSGSSSSVIAGGQQNDILSSSTFGFIGGGYDNTITEASIYAVIGGGYQNIIQGGGDYSGIGGGIYNDIDSTSHSNYIAGGRENAIASDSQRSFIGAGYQNVITGANYSSILGGDNNQIQADAHYGTIIGNNTHIEASAERVIAMGTGARGRRYGERVYTTGELDTTGDNGYADLVLLAKTTDATPTEMFIGNVSNKRVTIPNNSTCLIKFSWVRRNVTDAKQTSTNGDLCVLVKRGASAATTAVVASWASSGSATYQGDDTAPAGDIVTTSADTTNGSLKFTVTGRASKTILWFVEARIMEIIE